MFLDGADRDQLDPILDACVAVYVDKLDEGGQVDFKGQARVFCRTYAFLSSVIPYSNAEWEKLFQFYKQFVENESFKRFVGDMVFAITSP